MKLADAVFGREARHVKALGDTIKALDQQLQHADARQDRFSERLGEAEKKLEACEEKHDECERRVKAVSEELAGAKVEIAQLMSAAIPDYKPSDLRRPKTRKGGQ